MKIVELRKLDIEKLNEKLVELRNKNRELRFSIANNQLKNVRELRIVKKDIAKILTVLNEKRVVAESKSKETKEVKK
ncbi:MAG: 50S ribosomal protein L29 [Candidatus Pacebacteria bacterium]|jgi:large subunit ribosomal protein L29|nr:50S ribosomal protein L29 [Candidatus Paceibacterota bacterium]MBT4652221.1 50S ribosomal protein L29 [Candidatus Paceibacterota bacterium]MBT6755664.1 50S ribosomal protein L29 [Candidatus Paceibacterota bacterium]MBT6920983.1 50S ribosomal protein L29 [Candidatus Paceibacterota bacterium]